MNAAGGCRWQLVLVRRSAHRTGWNIARLETVYLSRSSLPEWTVMSRTSLEPDAVFIVSILVLIALAVTVFALLLQRSFGRSLHAVAAGPAFAFSGVLLLTGLSNTRR